jgi:hypothetical protein
MRERRIVFDAELAADPQEFARIFVHEVFHFVWLRLGNPRRWSYEALLREEMRAARAASWAGPRSGASIALAARDAWRAAPGAGANTSARASATQRPGSFRASAHPEYTLARRFRERRRQWFVKQSDVSNRISI